MLYFNAFVKDHQEYIRTGYNDPAAYTHLYSTYPAEIEKFYPSVIIKMIKETLIQSVKWQKRDTQKKH